jgi:hypothetical protein
MDAKLATQIDPSRPVVRAWGKPRTKIGACRKLSFSEDDVPSEFDAVTENE